MEFEVVRSLRALQAAIARHRNGPLNSAASVAIIPTMGAIHEAHEKLIDEAKKHADIIMASIFVNPKQFSKNEDFDEYPKSEKEDIAKLKARGCDIVFIPDVDLMYPEDFDLTINVPKLSSVLCGKSRPNHFEGVATVVAKLLIQSNADYAVFGEKDYQQLLIIKTLVKSLNISCKIIEIETVRDDEGCALSSRNLYLDKTNKQIANQINIILKETIKNYSIGDDLVKLKNSIREKFISKGIKDIDYIEVMDSDNLEESKIDSLNKRIFIAVNIEGVRLIDNMKLKVT